MTTRLAIAQGKAAAVRVDSRRREPKPRALVKTCAVCGATFERRGNARTCGPVCGDILRCSAKRGTK